MKKRIRFLINTLSGGGAERVLIDLLKIIPTQQYEIELVVVSGGAFSSEVPKGIRYRQVVKCKSPKLKALLEKLVYKMPARLFSLLFLHGTFDAEIAYLEGFPTHMIAVRRNKSKSTFAFVHTADNFISNCYKGSTDCLKEYSSFSKVCFVSENALEEFEKAVGEKLDNASVIHNVINIKGIITKSKEACTEDFQTNGKKMVAVGRLVSQKNFSRLISVCSKLEKQFEFELWIIGEGAERADLEEIIEKNQVHSVRLMGFRSNPYAFMNKADLFVCSSSIEGYSTAVTEAMGLGLPVITTSCAGMDEILENGKYGMIVENTDEALYSGLETILRDESVYNRLKQAALEKQQLLINRDPFEDYEKLLADI